MLAITQNVIIILSSVALAVAFLTFLRTVWDPLDRCEHNTVIGWHLGVLGTTVARTGIIATQAACVRLAAGSHAPTCSVSRTW